MPASLSRAQLDDLSTKVLDVAFAIHKKYGPGLLESVYVRLLTFLLRRRGLKVEVEVPVHLKWEDEDLGVAFRADIIVEDDLVLEVKAADGDSRLFAKQLLTYLRLLDKPLGYVLNFNHVLMKDGIERVVNNLR